MPLFVYKSSAGSGKTTTLVNEYLKITLQNPNAFRHILAITFTNKAAAEMKERVLDALKQIIAGQNLDQGEYADLFKNVGVSDAEFIKRADELQSLILHNYDEFSISTIDSFVHRIIKTFATDVKLPQNFEVMIDKEDFVPDIVGELFGKIGNDKALTDILVNFVLNQTEDEKTYNVSHELNKFVEKQIREEGFQHLQKIDHLSTTDFLSIIQKLNKAKRKWESMIKSTAKDAIQLIHSNNLDIDDFYRKGSGIYGYFKKCEGLASDKNLDINSFVIDTVKNERWTAAKVDVRTINLINTIKDELIDKFNIIQKTKTKYLRIKLIYSRIYALALTHEIRSIFVNYTERTQKVHISEFNKRISSEIAGQPVPFIYERLGRKYRYFLIDEFQDTSILQWQNLLPLINESLAYNNFNMLVGDAKQAIYRFRSGEVELFVNLPELLQNDGSQLMMDTERMLKSQYREVQLNLNWRSDFEIVHFNNAFFNLIKQGQSDHIQNIYANHNQQLPVSKSKTGGYVSIDLIDAKHTEEYSTLRLEKIKNNIDQLIAKDYRQKDICVLTRTNKYAIEVASYLLEKGYRVVSSESLLLSNAPEVRLITAFYYLLHYPGEHIYLAEVISNLLKIEGDEADFHAVFNKANSAFRKGLDDTFSCLGLPLRHSEMVELPVYELAEYIIRKLGFSKSVNIYLQYFLDFVFEAQQNGQASLGNFIDLWELKKNKSYITMPDGNDAIKVMTVHKAKGLKFEAVIVDLINRGNKSGKDEYWTELNEPGIEELEIGLLPISSNMEKVGLSEVYEREKEKTILDFLNLIYVAFTRPVSALFIHGHLKSEKASDSFTKYLVLFLEGINRYKSEKKIYEFGILKKLKNENMEPNKDEIVTLKKLVSSSWEDQIKIAPADEVYWEAIDSKPARTYGNLIHAMLAKIVSADDIDNVIKRYRIAGLIDNTESKEIDVLLNQLVTHPDLKQYYQKGLLIKNETELFDEEENIVSLLRPDRVVFDDHQLVIIDYKTGDKENKHQKQINRYAKAFKKLGFHEIEKKLVYLNEQIEVVNVS